MRNQTPVASGLSISESKRKVDRGRWVWPISRGDWHRWDRQPIRRALAPESPGPHFPPFPLTPGVAAAELASPGAALLSRPLLRPLLRTRGAWRVMASSGCEDVRGQDAASFLYFAYGSNLLTERIQLRNPSAAFCCVARLQVSAPHPTDQGAGHAALTRKLTAYLHEVPPGRALLALAALCWPHAGLLLSAATPATVPPGSLPPGRRGSLLSSYPSHKLLVLPTSGRLSPTDLGASSQNPFRSDLGAGFSDPRQGISCLLLCGYLCYRT